VPAAEAEVVFSSLFYYGERLLRLSPITTLLSGPGKLRLPTYRSSSRIPSFLGTISASRSAVRGLFLSPYSSSKARTGPSLLSFLLGISLTSSGCLAVFPDGDSLFPYNVVGLVLLETWLPL